MSDGGRKLARTSVADTWAIMSEVFLPTIAKGVIIRRPKVVGLAESLNLDTRAVKRMQKVRQRYGPGPVMLRMPRKQALILEPEHVRHVLDGSPEPFATASWEKCQALAHFEPKGSLVSHGAERAERRRFNEQVLQTNEHMHKLAESFVAVAEREAQEILAAADEAGELTWQIYIEGWFRMVRLVIFGPSARDDKKLRDMADQLRSLANWAFLALPRPRLRKRFHQRIREHLSRGEEGSLAGYMTHIPQGQETAPEQQVPQWLFAFDPAGMASFRALGLLASFPEHQERARLEIHSHDAAHQPLSFLRAAVLESLRLWPTTPMVLRETTRDVAWDAGVMPKGTSVLIYAPYFHRDDERLAYAHRFEPDLWLGDPEDQNWPLIPFSAGPAVCPGRHIVLLQTSAMLASLLREHAFEHVSAGRIDPNQTLPGTLDNYTLRFRLRRAATVRQA